MGLEKNIIVNKIVVKFGLDEVWEYDHLLWVGLTD